MVCGLKHLTKQKKRKTDKRKKRMVYFLLFFHVSSFWNSLYPLQRSEISECVYVNVYTLHTDNVDVLYQPCVGTENDKCSNVCI